MSKNKNEFNIELPKVDSTPMGIIGMEGDVFRGITDTTRHKSLFVRIVSIFFCLFLMVLPGLFGLGLFAFTLLPLFASYTTIEYIIWGFVFLFMCSMMVVLVIAGLKGIWANFKK